MPREIPVPTRYIPLNKTILDRIEVAFTTSMKIEYDNVMNKVHIHCNFNLLESLYVDLQLGSLVIGGN